MSTNLTKQEPYFDEFNKNKNHVRVAFRAGRRPVQARELNEMQSIFNSQLGALSNHLFKNGTKVSGGSISINKTQFVRLITSVPTNSVRLKSSTGVEASIVKIEESFGNDPEIVYVVYTKAVKTKTTFNSGEVIYAYDKDGNQLLKTNVAIKETSADFETTGAGVLITVREGVFYVNEMFINVDEFTFTAMKYSTDQSIVFGLIPEESITTYLDDPTLLDNALGYPNFKAPGADRISVNFYPIVTSSIEDITDESFIKLVEFENGVTTYILEDTDYSNIMDTLAKRTYEESGHYTVEGFGISFREHLKNSNNPTGLYTVDNGGDESKIVSVVSPGIAYVLGYRVKTISNTNVIHNKSRETILLEDQSISIPEHQFVRCTFTNSTGTVRPGTMSLSNSYEAGFVSMYDSANNPIGTAIVSDVLLETQKDPAVSSVYRVYIHSLQFNPTKTIKDLRKFKKTTGSQVFEMSVIPSNKGTELINPNNATLLFDTGVGYIKSFMPDGIPNIDISWVKQFSGVIDSLGKLTFNAGTGAIFIPMGKPYTVSIAGSATSNPTRNIVGENVGGVASVNIDLSSTASLQMTGTHGMFATVSLRVFESNVRPSIKTLHSTTESFTTNDSQVYVISKPDVLRVTSIHTFTGTSEHVDVTDQFEFISGQRKDIVALAKIKLKGSDAQLGSNLVINFDYFENDSNGKPAFFTIDSYNAEIDNPLKDFKYADIPTFTEGGVKYSLASCIDFRPIETINGLKPAIPTSMGYSIRYNADVYTKRIDAIVVKKSGEISAIVGTPALSPVPPKVPSDMLKLGDVHLNEYGFDIPSGMMLDKNYTRRYTMADIHRFDTRIKQVEYYTSLSLLEQNTLNMDVRDEFGNNRYKNGFMVDDFSKFQSADITNPEYKASNDSVNKELKPTFTMRNIPFIINKHMSTRNGVNFDSVYVPEFNNEVLLNQNLASKSISINPAYVFAREGNLTLIPNVDSWADTERLPNATVNFDGATDALREIARSAGLLNVNWGAWNQVNRTVNTTGWSWGDGWSWGGGTQTTTVRTDQSRTGTFMTIEDRVQRHSIDAVTNVSLEPYMRSRRVLMVASNMSPGIKLNAFFDDENINEFCAPFGQSIGSELIVNNRGNFIGVFEIPENKFFAGEKSVTLTPANDLNNLEDFSSYCKSTYYSAGINQEKQRTDFNISSPVVNNETVTQNRTTVTQSSWSWEIEPPPPPPPPWNPPRWDPVAQSFLADEDCFITGVDLYFAAKDTKNIWVQLRETQAGFPVSDSIAHVDVPISKVNISDDASVATHVKFKHPVRIKGGEFYAIVVGGSSPETRIWVSELGKPDVRSDRVIDTNKALGVLFKSQNGTTWTAEQKEDIKLRVYRAVFKSLTTSLYYDINVNNEETFTKAATALETQSGSDRVRILCKGHGLIKNDYVKLSQHGAVTLVSDTEPHIGQTISTPTGSFIVKSVFETNVGYYTCETRKLTGYVLANQTFTAEEFTISYDDVNLINEVTDENNSEIIINEFTGIVSGLSRVVSSINGIAAQAIFSGNKQVIDVDSLDSFVILTGDNANKSGIVNKTFSVLSNIDYDLLNFSLTENIESLESAHTLLSTRKHTYDRTPNVRTIYANADMRFAKTGVVTSKINNGKAPGNISTRVHSLYRSQSKYLAPIINMNNVSVTAISFNVDNFFESQVNISPNATDRYKPETHPLLGSSSYKYVSQTMQLVNTAYDIRFVIDVYKPIDSDFEIYYKTKQTYDDFEMDEVDWVLMNNVPKNFTSNSINDVREVSFTLSDIDESFDSTKGFDYLKIKIVGKTSNKANPPTFYNLRVLAIT